MAAQPPESATLPDAAARLDRIVANAPGHVFVTAHRGDWRDAPENSLQSLEWAARLGVDIVEFDVKRTRDGKYVVMHDPTIDRTTTGHGAVADLTLAEVEAAHLRAGTGHPTRYMVPTLADEFQAARDRHVILDVDTGWDYFNDVLAQARASHVTDQIVLNVFHNTPLPELERRVGRLPEDITIALVVNLDRPDAEAIVDSYRSHRRTIIQCDFPSDDTAAIARIATYRKFFPVWLNGLWPEQNAGHDDESAIDGGTPDATWGWLIGKGANIVQTDRPRELLEYLRRKHVR